MYIKIRRIATGSAPFVSGILAILLAIAIVSSPESSFAASLQGLKLWWTLVFPALLPFLMLSEMLTASGFVHGFGVLLEPLMTRIFGLPGAGGWTLAQGITAGFPGGAGGVAQLHKQGSITDNEAGRLASLAHFASPVTLLIVVGVALLHSPGVGYGLLAIHWLSGLLASFTASRWNRQSNDISSAKKITAKRKSASLPRRILQASADARKQDGRSFGKLLSESVAAAVQTLMIVGGYMIMFAVISSIVTSLFPMLPSALPASLFEIHLGAGAISESAINVNAGSVSGMLGLALLSAALGWSGLCAQIQVLTVLKSAGVKFLPFAAVRLLHGLYAFGLTLLLWKPLLALRIAVLPALAGSETLQAQTVKTANLWSFAPKLLGLQALLLLLLSLLSLAVYLLTAIRHQRG